MERGGDGGGCNVVTTEGFRAKGNKDLSLFPKQDVWTGPHARRGALYVYRPTDRIGLAFLDLLYFLYLFHGIFI